MFTHLGICITEPGVQRHLTLAAHVPCFPSVFKYKYEAESSKFLCTQDLTCSISSWNHTEMYQLCVSWALVQIHLGLSSCKGPDSAGISLCWAVWVEKLNSTGRGKIKLELMYIFLTAGQGVTERRYSASSLIQKRSLGVNSGSQGHLTLLVTPKGEHEQ